VEVFRESDGGDVVLGTLGPGDIFGEMIFLNKSVDIGCDYLPLHTGKEFRNPMKGRIKNLSMTGLRMEVSSVNASSAIHEVARSFRVETVLPNGQPLKLTAKIVNVHKHDEKLQMGMQLHDLPDYDGTRKTLWFFMLPT
jgi:CRP-like cAMP-binding protein